MSYTTQILPLIIGVLIIMVFRCFTHKIKFDFIAKKFGSECFSKKLFVTNVIENRFLG